MDAGAISCAGSRSTVVMSNGSKHSPPGRRNTYLAALSIDVPSSSHFTLYDVQVGKVRVAPKDLQDEVGEGRYRVLHAHIYNVIVTILISA